MRMFPLHIFRYEEIMNSAGEQGVRQTYSQLNHLMQDYPDVQEMLLDLLTGTIPFPIEQKGAVDVSRLSSF